MYQNPLLLSDTYKQTHDRMYPKGLTCLYSYWVPRKSMLVGQDKMVFFGLQAFINEFLIDRFEEDFFNMPLTTVVDSYKESMNIQLGEGNYDVEKIINLHNLGYLPLEIKALPEGSLVNMGIPCIEIHNTHPDFAWLVQWIECILQVELWKPCVHATIGHMYKKLALDWYDITVDDPHPEMACADFGMRGMSCLDEAVRCSAAWLLSFNKTSTIPALGYIQDHYLAPKTIGLGAVSTEHSVMGANFAVDGDEITFVKRLLTELYPTTSFSMVSDTYDYWNMVDRILPQCRAEILAHKGKLLVRPDSGNIVEIAVKTVEHLWFEFGGTYNNKGYKELDPHIGVIYGDGCSLHNVNEIWSQLEEKGFAANCITFGVGAFCFAAITEGPSLIINTRDTYGIAMKASYGEIGDKRIFIYKDPKTDTAKLKKSHKGCVIVYKDGENGFAYEDGLTPWATESEKNCLQTVFKDGDMIGFTHFEDIRKRMDDELG